MRTIGMFILIIFHILSINLFADISSSEIKVAASLSAKEVPLNRSVKFTIQVEWFGDLNLYEISEVENPEVRNFKIMSNSSSDRREIVQGLSKAIKTYEFELIPEELGMGYVEGVIIKYLDKASGESKHLITNRLDVKVIDSIPDPGSLSWIYTWFLPVFIFITAMFFFLVWQRKRTRKKRQHTEADIVVPLEKMYSDQLKQAIKLDSVDINIKRAFSELSLMLRKYLSEKFDLNATQAIKEEIIVSLKQKGASDRLMTDTEEILSMCDIVKFSGDEGKKSDLDRVYILFENILLTRQQGSEEE